MNPVAVTLAGHFAYVAGQRGLIVFDLTTPTNPVPIGGFKGPIDYVADSCAVSNLLFVAGGGSGLHILSVTNPAEPVQIGWYRHLFGSASARAVQVVGRYAFVADSLAGVLIIDVANPANPQHVTLYDTAGRANGIQIVGDYAYVADETAGLLILNVSNPASPFPVGAYDTQGFATRLFVAGNHAYVADSFSGLQIINVSNPTNPVFAGSYTNGGYISAVQVMNNVAAVTAGDAAGVVLLDISNPANPIEISRTGPVVGSPQDLKVEGPYAYVADYGSLSVSNIDQGKLHVVDVSHPTNAARVGGYSDTGGSARDVHAAGDMIYLADTRGGLAIIDASNLATPVATGVFTSSWINGVQVVSNLAFVAGNHGLEILNVSNRFQPMRLSGDGPWANAVQIISNLAFVAVRKDVFRIYDWSHPTNLSLLGFSDADEGEGLSLSITGATGAVYISGRGLDMVDFTDPADPYTIASDPSFRGGNGQVTMAGDRVYIASGQSLLWIINVENPAMPTEIGQFALTNGFASSVRVVGNRAYLGCGPAGLLVLDVSDPAQIRVLASYETPGSVLGLHVAEPLVYLAQAEWGLLILEVHAPKLEIVRTNNNVTLAWSPPNAGVVLQRTDDAVAGVWANVPGATNSPVTLPLDENRSFFRLRVFP